MMKLEAYSDLSAPARGKISAPLATPVLPTDNGMSPLVRPRVTIEPFSSALPGLAL